MLSAIEGVTCVEPEGAFYAFPSLRGGPRPRAAEGSKPATTLELAELVLEEARVAFVPGEAFGAPGYGRFSYALSDEDLVRGIERLGELFARGERLIMARILVTETALARRGLELMAKAGHDVDVRARRSRPTSSSRPSPARPPSSSARPPRDGRGARGRPRPRRRRPGRHRARQRRRRGGDAAGRDGRQRPAVEHPLRGRARRRAAARPGPQHPPSARGPRRTGAGSARSGRASSCTARRSGSSASAESAPSWPSARPLSGCGSSPTTRT